MAPGSRDGTRGAPPLLLSRRGHCPFLAAQKDERTSLVTDVNSCIATRCHAWIWFPRDPLTAWQGDWTLVHFAPKHRVPIDTEHLRSVVISFIYESTGSQKKYVTASNIGRLITERRKVEIDPTAAVLRDSRRGSRDNNVVTCWRWKHGPDATRQWRLTGRRTPCFSRMHRHVQSGGPPHTCWM